MEARENIDQLVSKNRIQNAKQLQSLILQNRELWFTRDRLMVIEIAFAGAAGSEEGETYFMDSFMSFLPDGDRYQLSIQIQYGASHTHVQEISSK